MRTCMVLFHKYGFGILYGVRIYSHLSVLSLALSKPMVIAWAHQKRRLVLVWLVHNIWEL